MFLKKIRLLNIIICIITVLSILSLIMPTQKIHADSEDKSLTLVCVQDDVILEGMKWKLYKVGERRNTAQNFVQTGDFADYQINLRNLSVERVTEAAQTFQAYAIANKIAPMREGATDHNGEVTFSGLSAGLYLVTGKLLKIDSYYYVPTTALVEIKENDQNLRYNAYPKFSYRVMNQAPRSYTVRKVWQNDEDKINERPASIVVDLYKDEELYDSVVLDEASGWKYRWVDEDGVSAWIAMERNVPNHYEMRVSYDDSRYIIENSYFEDAKTTTPIVSNETVTTSKTTASFPYGDGSATRTGTTTTTTTVSGSLNNSSSTRTGTATTSSLSGSLGDGSATRTGTGTGQQQNAETTTASGNGNGNGNNNGNGNGNGNNNGNGNGNGYGNGNGKGNGYSSGSSGGKLPQTGQLWWPVMPLSIGGVILIAAGLTIRARKKSDR